MAGQWLTLKDWLVVFLVGVGSAFLVGDYGRIPTLVVSQVAAEVYFSLEPLWTVNQEQEKLHQP